MLDLGGPPSRRRDRPRPGTRSIGTEPPSDERPGIPVVADRADTVSSSGHARKALGGGPRAVSAVLTGRRLVAVVALVLLLPGILGAAALSSRPPEPPPAEIAPSFASLEPVPDPAARAQSDRSQRVSRLTDKLTAPTLFNPAQTGSAGPGELPTLALTPRAEPYSLHELRELVPAVFSPVDGIGEHDALLVRAHLQVPFGASLVIDGRTPDVRLISTPSGFASIISRGTVTVAGDAAHRVRISSWDPEAGHPDTDSVGGRAFVLQMGGRMDATYAVFDYLGFGQGVTSGVAWSGVPANGRQAEPVKAQGDVRSSMFLHNYFGVYSREARNMLWRGNVFAGNEQYGFDPHDFSNNFVVTGNISYRNGKHGFIFSRGCSGNVLRGNFAEGNGGHGFMIDDGRSRATATSPARIDGSNSNLVLDNVARGNAGNGVEIEGGIQNMVVGNRLTDNYVGVRIKDDASAAVRDNLLTNNRRYGIDVHGGEGEISISGNTIVGSWGGVNLDAAESATVGANDSSDVSAALVVGGVAVRDSNWPGRVATFLRWNPLLLLWSLLVGVPIVVAVLRGMGRLVRTTRPRTPPA